MQKFFAKNFSEETKSFLIDKLATNGAGFTVLVMATILTSTATTGTFTTTIAPCSE